MTGLVQTSSLKKIINISVLGNFETKDYKVTSDSINVLGNEI